MPADHDMLIRLEEGVNSLSKTSKSICTKLDTFRKENREDHSVINNTCLVKSTSVNDKVDEKVNFSTFKLAIILIAGVLISLGSYTIGIDRGGSTQLKGVKATLETHLGNVEAQPHLYKIEN